MQSKNLGQEKIEHAVLWSMVKEDYSEEFCEPTTIRAHLLNICLAQQIQNALDHLIECGMVRERSAVLQADFEPTRDAQLRIESHIANKTSFVGRLNIHGPGWLKSQSALDAKLHTKLTPKSKKEFTSRNEVIRSSGEGPAGVTVINNNNPSFTSSNANTNHPKASSNWAGWVGSIATVGILIVTAWYYGLFK